MTALSAEPLLAFVASRVVVRPSGSAGCSFQDGVTSLFEPGSWQHRAYERAKQTGTISDKAADKLCCYLGHHPTSVYTDWYRLTYDGVEHRN